MELGIFIFSKKEVLKIRKLNTVGWASEEVYCPVCKSLIYMDGKFSKCEHIVYRKSISDSLDPPEYDRDGYFDRMDEEEIKDQLGYLHNYLNDNYQHICITFPPPVGISSHYVFQIKN